MEALKVFQLIGVYILKKQNSAICHFELGQNVKIRWMIVSEVAFSKAKGQKWSIGGSSINRLTWNKSLVAVNEVGEDI